MKTLEISLPTFTGFYESIWENSDTMYDTLINEGVSRDNLDGWEFDNESYEKDVAEEYADFYESYVFNELGIDYKTKKVTIDSPMYYNFTTDKIYCEIEIEDEKEFFKHIKELMLKHKVELKKMIYEHHTSCDGFISFMSNQFEDWYVNIDNLEDTRILSYTLAYLALINYDKESGGDDFEIHAYYYVFDHDIYLIDYMTPTTDEAKKEWEELNC